MKNKKYNIGDIVHFKEAKHHWSSSQSTSRDMAFPLLEGNNGEVIGLNYTNRWNSKTLEYVKSMAGVKYPYIVKFVVKTRTNKQLTYTYPMAEDELESVFTL